MVTKLRPRSFTAGLLDRIERWGNKLPHPFNLFILFSLMILIFSYLAHALGLAVVHPLTGKQIAAVNLTRSPGYPEHHHQGCGEFYRLCSIRHGAGRDDRGRRGGAERAFFCGPQRIRKKCAVLADYDRVGICRGQRQSHGGCGVRHLHTTWRGPVCASRPPSDCRVGCRLRWSIGRVQRQPVSHAARSASGWPDPGGSETLRSEVRGPGHGKLLLDDWLDFLADRHRCDGNQLDYRAEIGSVSNARGARFGSPGDSRKARLESCGDHSRFRARHTALPGSAGGRTACAMPRALSSRSFKVWWF